MIDSDLLSYDVVVARLESGDWWHGHLVRSDMEYDSVLFGRRTTLLFVMTRFGPSAIRKSADMFLTLDAEGVPDELFPIGFDADWTDRADNMALKMDALHLPLLHDSQEFQKAMASIVSNQVYAKVANANRFSRSR